MPVKRVRAILKKTASLPAVGEIREIQPEPAKPLEQLKIPDADLPVAVVGVQLDAKFWDVPQLKPVPPPIPEAPAVREEELVDLVRVEKMRSPSWVELTPGSHPDDGSREVGERTKVMGQSIRITDDLGGDGQFRCCFSVFDIVELHGPIRIYLSDNAGSAGDHRYPPALLQLLTHSHGGHLNIKQMIPEADFLKNGYWMFTLGKPMSGCPRCAWLVNGTSRDRKVRSHYGNGSEYYEKEHTNPDNLK